MSGTGQGTRELTERELEVLRFERDWHLQGGHKQHAIRDTFKFAPSYYYQLLARLIERPEAEEADPLLVRRLRRQRQARNDAVGLTVQVTRGGRRPATQ